MFYIIMYLFLALSPGIVYACFRTKTRAWITIIVITLIVDIVVILYLLSGGRF